MSTAPELVDAPTEDATPGFAAVVQEHEDALLRHAHYLLAPAGHRPPPPAHSDAQDAVQDALLRLHRQQALPGAAAIEHPRAWLLRVTHNLAMDALRRRRTRRKHALKLQEQAAARPEDTQENASPLQGLANREALEASLRLLNDLPPRQQEVLRLRMTEDLTLRQVGEVLGISHSKVYQHLNKGLATLARQLKQAEVI